MRKFIAENIIKMSTKERLRTVTLSSQPSTCNIYQVNIFPIIFSRCKCYQVKFYFKDYNTYKMDIIFVVAIIAR